jgi:type II secretory pathway component PulM
MRWAELALFLAPFALYAAWRIAAARARPSIVWGTSAVVGVLVVGTVWAGLARRLDRHEAYVPAHWQNGRIVTGHGAPLAAGQDSAPVGPGTRDP